MAETDRSKTRYCWFISSGAIAVKNRLEKGDFSTLSDLVSRFSEEEQGQSVHKTATERHTDKN